MISSPNIQHSKETPGRNSHKDGRQHTGAEQGAYHGLDEDGVLNLAEDGLLDPNLTVKDLAHNVALLILDDPGLVLVAVGGPEGLEASLLQAGFLVVGVVAFNEQLPGPHVSVVHAMQHNAHTLVGRDERRDADDPAYGRQRAPAATRPAQGQEKGGHGGEQDDADAQAAGEEDAGRVAIADGPTDEVGVGLPP